jgi:hypothetical protein
MVNIAVCWVMVSLSSGESPEFGRAEGKLVNLTEGEDTLPSFDTAECCYSIRSLCHAEYHFKSCFVRYINEGGDNKCSKDAMRGTCPFCFDKSLEENQDLDDDPAQHDPADLDPATKSAAATVCQEVTGEAPPPPPNRKELKALMEDEQRAEMEEQHTENGRIALMGEDQSAEMEAERVSVVEREVAHQRQTPESKADAMRCPIGELQAREDVCHLVPSSGACENEPEIACQRSVDMHNKRQKDPLFEVGGHAGRERCLCDSIWATCENRPYNNAGGSFDTMPSTRDELEIQPPEECPVRMFVLELDSLGAGILADDQLKQWRSNYHADIRAWQEVWNNEQKLNTNDHVSPVLDALLRASQNGCIVDDSSLADVIYVPWLSNWRPLEGKHPMPTASEMAVWIAQWTQKNMKDEQVFLFSTDSGMPSEHLDFEYELDEVRRGITKRIFYTVREPAMQQGCIGQTCPGSRASRDEAHGREPWFADITNIDKNMDGMLSFRQIVLPYIANAGLSSLVFHDGGSQYLLKKVSTAQKFQAQLRVLTMLL